MLIFLGHEKSQYLQFMDYTLQLQKSKQKKMSTSLKAAICFWIRFTNRHCITRLKETKKSVFFIQIKKKFQGIFILCRNKQKIKTS